MKFTDIESTKITPNEAIVGELVLVRMNTSGDFWILSEVEAHTPLGGCRIGGSVYTLNNKRELYRPDPEALALYQFRAHVLQWVRGETASRGVGEWPEDAWDIMTALMVEVAPCHPLFWVDNDAIPTGTVEEA